MLNSPLHIHHWPTAKLTSKPWICIHGFLGSGEDFDILIDQWEDHPDIQAPDLPGFGISPMNPPLPDTDNLCTSLRPIINHCERPPVLLGYSMGARLALQCAIAFPSKISALVLIGGTPGIQAKDERQARRLADAQWIQIIQSEGLDAFLEKWKQQSVISSQTAIAPDYYQAMQQRRSQLTPEVLCNYLEHFGTGCMPSAWELLAKIKLPTLLITGENDSKFTRIAQSMIHNMPQASHQIIPDCGHAAVFEKPSATIACLNDFLTDIETQS